MRERGWWEAAGERRQGDGGPGGSLVDQRRRPKRTGGKMPVPKGKIPST